MRVFSQKSAIGTLCVTALLACGQALPAQAGSVSVDVGYSLQISGFQLAEIDMKGEFNGGTYKLSGSGKSQSLAKLIAKFKGWTQSSGAIVGGKIQSGSYNLDFQMKKKRQSVAMQLASGKVAKLDIYPPEKPSDTRIPITADHRRGVLDPVSAVIVPLPKGDVSEKTLCNRTVKVFDGRHRYDLALTPKRSAAVPAAGGQGNATVFVCKVKYLPIAGHKPEAKDTVYWSAVEDMELWLSPIQSAGVAIPVRVSVPTPIGQAVLAVSRLDVTATQDHAALQ